MQREMDEETSSSSSEFRNKFSAKTKKPLDMGKAIQTGAISVKGAKEAFIGKLCLFQSCEKV